MTLCQLSASYAGDASDVGLRIHCTIAAVVVTLALTVAGCGDDDTTAPTTTAVPEPTETSAEVLEPIAVLVTNDDGIEAAGIDVLVNELTALEDVEVVVVAPAENQSVSSDSTTPDGVTFEPGATTGAYEGTAVDGLPADAVNVALDELGITPDLVVSGVNEGQNVGTLAAISGTVGAARVAVRRGIPAVAASAGFGDTADYAAAAALVVAWLEERRAAISDDSVDAKAVVSFNVPGCTAGDVGDLVEAPLATAIPEGVGVFETDCSMPPRGDPTDDVDAISQGYAVQTEVPPDL